MSMTPAVYNNSYRGKFMVDVTIRIQVATKHDGMKGFSEVSELLADKFRPFNLEQAYSWDTGHLESSTLLKITPTELAVPPMVDIPEAVVEEEE